MPKSRWLLANGAIAMVLAAAATAGAADGAIKIGAATIHESNHEWMKVFKAGVESRSSGARRVDVYPAAQLGSIPRMLDGLQLGTIEAAVVPAGFMTGIDRRFGSIAAPGMFDDIMHGYRAVHDAEFAEAYWRLGEAKGVKLIGMYCPTGSSYVARFPLNGLDDLRGKKIRVFATAIEREILRAVGATPAPMSLEEVFPALLQGAIDGAKGPIAVFVSERWSAVARYALRSDESLICPAAAVSKAWLDKLPADTQRMVAEVAAATDERVQRFSLAFNEGSYAAWEESGGTLGRPTAASQAAMRQRLVGAVAAAVRDDPMLAAMYALISRVAARTRRN